MGFDLVEPVPLDIISKFGQASGQLINFAKSAVFFSKNTPIGVRTDLSSILGISCDAKLGNCLGLPAEIGGSKIQLFSYIQDRLMQHISGWQDQHITMAGKEVLIKSVAPAFPVYAMQIFKLPDALYQQLSSAMARFWWGGTSEKKKIHWIAWDILTDKKSGGGLGFRDIKSFNLALLAKHAWRLINHPHNLATAVLKAKYFPSSSLMQAKVGSRPSWC